MAWTRRFTSRALVFSLLSSWPSAALGQKAAFVIGEKVAGSIGFYDADGYRLSRAKVGSHPHEPTTAGLLDRWSARNGDTTCPHRQAALACEGMYRTPSTFGRAEFDYAFF